MAGTADSDDTADSADVTADAGNAIERVSALLRVSPNVIIETGSPIVAGSVTRRSTTRDQYVINIAPFVARYWDAAKFFSDGDVTRPLAKQDGGIRGSTGCDNSAIGSGQTAEVEPKWAKAIGAQVADGAALFWLSVPSTPNALTRMISDADQITWTTDDPLAVEAGAFRNTGGELEFGCWVTGGTSGTPGVVVAHVAFTNGSTQDFGIVVTVDDNWPGD